MQKSPNFEKIFTLLRDSIQFAEHFGLHFWEHRTHGYERVRWGRGFRYKLNGEYVTDPKLIVYFKSLVLPPAWEKTIIATKKNSHILAYGKDAADRVQYRYHERWSAHRNILHFYKLVPFYTGLKKVRRWANAHLENLDSEAAALATIIKILDDQYLRIGNENYYEKNNTVGLTTLTGDHLEIEDGVIKMDYKAKSNKARHIEFKNADIEAFLEHNDHDDAQFIFNDWSPQKVNQALADIAGVPITAKDFRTWGGTFAAYKTLCTKEKKAEIEAIKSAAKTLGNTPAVARKSYVHPHVVEAYDEKKYQPFFETQNTERQYESELVELLNVLYIDKLQPLLK